MGEERLSELLEEFVEMWIDTHDSDEFDWMVQG